MRQSVKRFGVFLIIALMAGGSFGTMRKFELKELTAQATHVVSGAVLSTVSGWTLEGAIETRVRIRVDQYLMGLPGGGSVDLAIPGGEVGGLGLAVSDMPRFVAGTRVLLFLSMADPRTPRVAGLHQGKFTLREGRVIENGLAEDEFLRLVRAEIRAKQEAR